MSDYELVLEGCRRGGKLTDEEVEQLRRLSPQHRSDLIIALCQEAAIAEANRIKVGLPPTKREPWHESTWEFLRKCAAQSQTSTNRNEPRSRQAQNTD